MTTVVVAGVSVRAMAESARRAGFDVIALDVFGDTDTRAAARRWHGIGGVQPFEIDADRFVAALAECAAEADVRAWIPGAGFESQPQALARGERTLVMAGTAAEDVARLRDPRAFFAGLAAAGIAHPPVAFAPRDDADGWLVKDAGGRGGWHVRPAASLQGGALPPGHYLQREAPGVPMSATFLADGAAFRRVGINRQRERRFGARQHVFSGVTGPVEIGASAVRQIDAALAHLVPTYRLKGLGSLDVLLDGDHVAVLEVNPRPPASFVLHEGAASLVAAHLDACLEGRLRAAAPCGDGRVRGVEIVYARRALTVSAAAAERLARAGCHDRPVVGTRLAPGDPLCTLSAEGTTAEIVERRLEATRDELLTTLETLA